MKKISICIPVLNEEDNLTNIYQLITELFKNDLKRFDYEIIFTDNHSLDGTQKIIEKISTIDNKVKYIRFYKNLLYDKSILEAYNHSSGDAAIVLDADLQDPPELILKFIEKWEEGFDLVYGIRSKRIEPYIFSLMRRLYYKIINSNSALNYPLDAGGFRLIDRSIVNKLKKVNNLYPYIRGLTYSFSKRSFGFEYLRKPRQGGKSKLGVYNTFAYALNALFEETIFFTKIFRRFTFIYTIALSLFTIINIILFFKFLSIWQNIVLVITLILIFGISFSLEYLTRIYFHLKKNSEEEIYEKKINL